MTMTDSKPSKTDRLRVVFMGSDPIAIPLLEWMHGKGASRLEIVGVFTQPDRAVGRGQRIVANEIKRWAQARDLTVFQPEKLTESVREKLEALVPDVAVVMAYGHILRNRFISTPRLGTLNLHASLLPRYRGASPIQCAIANGEQETGVALMRIVRELDAGPVADVERVPIDALDTALEVEAKLAAACVPLVARNVEALASNRLVFEEQDHANATFCRRLNKDDGRLDFGQPAGVLAARINGLFPWPGCRISLLGQVVKLGLADVPADPDIDRDVESGTICGADEIGLLVRAGDRVVRMRKLQRPGGKMLPAGDFLRGFPIPAGTRIESHPFPRIVASRPFH